jgi:hypothetical protein
MIPRCPEPMEIKEVGHFIQDGGEEIAKNAQKTFNL